MKLILPQVAPLSTGVGNVKVSHADSHFRVFVRQDQACTDRRRRVERAFQVVGRSVRHLEPPASLPVVLYVALEAVLESAHRQEAKSQRSGLWATGTAPETLHGVAFDYEPRFVLPKAEPLVRL